MKVTCVLRFKDEKTDKIIGYRLMDKNRMYKDFEPNELKTAISQKLIAVDNLKLTSDGRLILKNDIPDKLISVNENNKFNPVTASELAVQKTKGKIKNKKIAAFLKRAFFLKRLTIIPTRKDNCPDDECIYIVDTSKPFKRHSRIIYIADNVAKIPYHTAVWEAAMSDYYKEYNTKVIGGNGLVSLYNGFSKIYTNTLDISELNTSKVTDMSGTFCYAHINKLVGLDKIDTSKVERMNEMFCCYFRTLPELKFNTSMVKDMRRMFAGYSPTNENTCLDVSSLDTSSLRQKSDIFSECEARQIIGFDGEYVKNE